MCLPVHPNLPSVPGPGKGLCGPFLAGASSQGEAESVPPSRSPRPQLAHGPGEGGKQGGRTNSNQLKTEPGTRRLWGAQISLSLCGSAVRESDSDLAIQERNP